jgi:hypothetical protein
MGADFSRVRFNPLRDYAGVELQQGRVLADADANELMAITDRRLRALASDMFGRDSIVHYTRRLQDHGCKGRPADRQRPPLRRRAARREPWCDVY